MKKSFSDIVNVEFTAQMEENLDKIEQGNKNWVDVVREFYGDFEKEVDKATKELEHVKLEDPVSDVACDKCGRMMVIKTGRYGKFLACPGYPECKNTKPIIEEVGADWSGMWESVDLSENENGEEICGMQSLRIVSFPPGTFRSKESCPEMRTVYRNCTGEKRKILEMQQ